MPCYGGRVNRSAPDRGINWIDWQPIACSRARLRRFTLAIERRLTVAIDNGR